MIEFKSVQKSFGRNRVLDNLDLSIDGQGIFAILGPNGSGKTTLIKLLLGMVMPDAGSIFLKNQDIKNAYAYREAIQYLPQIANFPNNLSVRELFAMIKDLRPNVTREKELIDQFRLAQFLDKKLVNLSGGTKQKVNIVLTFMFDQPVVILDEPTTGLDPHALIVLKELLKKERDSGKTILVTTHILQFVEEMADEIIYILEGKIYFKGKLDELYDRTGQKDLEHAVANIIINERDV